MDGWMDGWAQGGYMAAKVSKLQEQFQKDAPREKQKHGASSSIFSGVAIYVNGYTDPSADELRRLMMLHGGQFHLYYSRSKTTHIIATNLPNSKIQELKGEKVVRPEWITDSIKAGQQLSYLQYQLYAKQKGLNFTNVHAWHGQDAGGSCHGLPEPNLNLPQKRNQEHSRSNPAFIVTPTLPSRHADKTHCRLDIKLNGLYTDFSEHEGLSVNGIHDGDTNDNSSGIFLKEKDCIQTNGHAHPLNGALKLKDSVACSKRALQVESSFPQVQPPQSESEEMGRPSCSRSAGLASDHVASTASTSLALSPQVVIHHEQSPDSSILSEPASATISAVRKNSEKSEISRVRLNGSHYIASDSTLNDSNNQTGKSPAKGSEAGIISEFFSHSRLHHISTWRNEFSEYVNALQSRRRATGGAAFSGKERLKKLRANHCGGSSSMPAPQVRQSCILHVDMDCFFVSVGIRHRPELIGKPVAVTSNRGRGLVPQRPGANPQLEMQYYQKKQNQHRAGRTENDLEMTPSPESEETCNNGVEQSDHAALSMAEIASCSYEARKAGVRNGMFFGQAKQLCPELQSVPYDFHAYKEVALAMYETLASYTYNIEALSCDEALVDATALLAELGITPDELASAIRADVREKTGCSASIGMGSNILLARMATRKAKPNGQYFLRPEEVDDFIRDQSVTSLPGVGRSMSSKLASLGVSTCGDLQQVSMVRLQKEFGPRTGQTLFRFCRGLDDRPVRSEKERKSVSAEMNYNIRFTQIEEAETFLTNLSMEVQKRLHGSGLRGRRITLKVMMRKAGAPLEPAKYGGHGICDNLARSVLLAQPTDSGQLIAAEVIKLFRAMKLTVTDMRGVGLQMQLLESSHSDTGPARSRSIRDLFTSRRPAQTQSKEHQRTDNFPSMSSNQDKVSSPSVLLNTLFDSEPGTSKGEPSTPSHSRAHLNLSIEVPSPSQVDRSVLEALPLELREQVEQSWNHREEKPSTSSHLFTPHRTPSSTPSVPLAGALLVHLPDQSGQIGSTGIVLELPDFSQVDPDVFAALPRELQEELRSAYRCRENTLSQSTVVIAEQRNPLLQLKQPAVGKMKRRYKRKNSSPAKKGASPLKRLLPGTSPAKSSPSKIIPLSLTCKDAPPGFKTESAPPSSSLNNHVPDMLSKFVPRSAPALAGACELGDIRALLREWVTTISEPMEEDILQVVKYCTELVEDKDLEKLDLVIKYMKRLMQQSVESVWSMAFDFILDNVQVVVQQTYGGTLKIT
ncbi:DNA repair protein REV1 isoform X2 [Salminus brasiliensis]|uniref:DNA repair protein REV1 isoform X2 n=1 Tax=Salminus brasiliensis TaxID=930266 RepID=UPI003B82E90E